MHLRDLILFLVLYQGHAVSASPEYDFIIVGGGTAGCLLAARLTEYPNWKVLLLEAGDEESFIFDIPLVAPMSILSTENWGYKAEPSETYGLGLRDGRLVWPRGKALGGSSAINGMVYTRGNRKDFDNWESLGNKGWGYKDVLPYFLKFEKMNIPDMAKNRKYHSTEGELEINYPPYHTSLSSAFMSAGLEKRYKKVDPNGSNQIGFSYSQTTIKNGARMSSYSAFLEPVRKRKNLKILKRTLVTKVLIDPQTMAANGVEYKLYNWIQRKVHAKKEVIVSAGSTNSPQLLMLSGIGPKDHLQDMGIKVIQDLKVGYNMKDHVSLINLYFTVNDSVDIHLNKPLNVVYNLLEYFLKRDGEFTVPSGFEAMSFHDIDGQDGYPEIELFFSGMLLPTLPFYLSRLGVLSDSFNTFYEPLTALNGFTVFPILLHPYSVGRLMLKDKDPMSNPLIYPHYFSDHRDMDMVIKGIRLTIEFMQTKAFQKFGTHLYREPLPPCRLFDFGTDSYWECAVRYMTLSIQHSVGTCKMGPDSDPDAVVDSRLRVRRVKNLRVVDASIMPDITSGHTMAPVYMVAEKAADMIKSDWT